MHNTRPAAKEYLELYLSVGCNITAKSSRDMYPLKGQCRYFEQGVHR